MIYNTRVLTQTQPLLLLTLQIRLLALSFFLHSYSRLLRSHLRRICLFIRFTAERVGFATTVLPNFCFAESAPERSSRVRLVPHFFAFEVGFSGLHKQCLRIVSCFAKVAAQSHTLSLLRKDVSLYMVADLCGFCLTCVLFLFQFFPPHHHMHQVLVRQHPRFLLQS